MEVKKEGYESYYDVAFLEYLIQTVDDAPVFNNFLVQEQQICEKMLKELVHRFVFTSDVQSILKSHKLVTLINAIQWYTEWGFTVRYWKVKNSIRFLF